MNINSVFFLIGGELWLIWQLVVSIDINGKSVNLQFLLSHWEYLDVFYRLVLAVFYVSYEFGPNR